MQKIIKAENSDLFDVLAYVAYALLTLTREERAARAKVAISNDYTPKQRAFIDFVLAQYIRVGVDELEGKKLADLLRLKYRSLPDALEAVRSMFSGFQRHLYAGERRREPASSHRTPANCLGWQEVELIEALAQEGVGRGTEPTF